MAFTAKIHSKDQNLQAKTGILLTNLGTPDEPTASALRRYLAEFLSDPRVVEIPRFIWLIILYGIILVVRPAKSAKLYKSIWTEDGSPLKAISIRQKNKLQAQLKEQGYDDIIVELGMRYGNPSIASSMQRLREQGVNRLIVLPLYPQYSAPTTGSTFDAISKELQQWRWVPEVHFLTNYYQNEQYIKALSNSIQEHFDLHGKPERLVLSYHGMPKQFFDNGDPYYQFCQHTTELAMKPLDFPSDAAITTFQSRFGNAEWLKPYTDETLETLAKDNVKHIAIISPAFSVDCLETLEELEEENKEIFLSAGGETYHYIPALNDRDDHINALFNIVSPHLPTT